MILLLLNYYFYIHIIILIMYIQCEVNVCSAYFLYLKIWSSLCPNNGDNNADDDNAEPEVGVGEFV